MPLNVGRRLLARYDELLVGLAEFAVVAALLYALGRLVVEPALHRLLSVRDIEPTLVDAIERTASVVVVLVAVAGAATVAGFGSVVGGSAVIVAAGTVALGFAAQDVVANLVSGAFIVTDRKFNVGDWIEWSEREGTIEAITFRATRVRTFDGELITVPNSELTTCPVTNRDIGDRLRINRSVVIAYDADVDRASRFLERVARDHPEVLDDPEPVVRVTDLGDDGVELTARFWIADPDRDEYSRVGDEYVRAVLDRVDDADVEISPASEHDLKGQIGLHSPRELPDDLRR